MQLEKTRDALNKFAKYVVQQSKSNLTKSDKNVSKELYNSIGYKLNVSKNSFGLDLVMQDYGVFQDKGVKGKTSSAKAPNSPFKFGSGTGKKGGLTNGIDKWVRRRGFQFRDNKGKFLSYQSTAFLITRSIYNKGIKPSMFFTKPFEKAFAGLNEDLIQAFALDVTKFMETTIKDNFKK